MRKRRCAKQRCPKGDAFVTAQLAGIMAAKQTPALIPLAHPLPLSSVEVGVRMDGRRSAAGRGAGAHDAQTGVEMEAMVAAAVAALTIYDMCKALDKGIDDRIGAACSKRAAARAGDWSPCLRLR